MLQSVCFFKFFLYLIFWPTSLTSIPHSLFSLSYSRLSASIYHMLLALNGTFVAWCQEKCAEFHSVQSLLLVSMINILQFRPQAGESSCWLWIWPETCHTPCFLWLTSENNCVICLPHPGLWPWTLYWSQRPTSSVPSLCAASWWACPRARRSCASSTKTTCSTSVRGPRRASESASTSSDIGAGTAAQWTTLLFLDGSCK